MYKTSASILLPKPTKEPGIRRCGLRHKHSDLNCNPSYCPSRSNLSQADLSSSDRNKVDVEQLDEVDDVDDVKQVVLTLVLSKARESMVVADSDGDPLDVGATQQHGQSLLIYTH